MANVVLVRDEDGKLKGLGEKGTRQFEKFRRTVEAMEVGETIAFSYKLPRSPKHHRLFFKKVRTLLERQETFEKLDDLRYWCTVGAGYCHFLPGTDGNLMAVPQSINFEELEEADFIDLHQRVDDFLWTERAQSVLWPELPYARTFAMVEAWRRDFERPTPRDVRTVAANGPVRRAA